MMRKFAKHVVFWVVVYVVWAYMKMGGHINVDFLFINLIHLGAYMAIFYSLKYLLIPRYYDNGRTYAFCTALLVASVAITLVWYMCMTFLSDILLMPVSTIPTSITGFVMEIIQFYVPGMFLLVWESYEDKALLENEAHILKRDQIATELNLLKAQINPEFIINTLKHLETEVDQKSIHAPDMILRLSSILDYILHDGQRDKIALSREIKASTDLIELQRMRLGQDYVGGLSLSGDMSCQVSPMVVFSLLEGIFRFWQKTSKGKLILSADIRQSSNTVHFIVSLPCNSHLSVDDLRSYLTGYMRRLSLMYPTAHQLDIIKRNALIEVSVNLKLDNG